MGQRDRQPAATAHVRRTDPPRVALLDERPVAREAAADPSTCEIRPRTKSPEGRFGTRSAIRSDMSAGSRIREAATVRPPFVTARRTMQLPSAGQDGFAISRPRRVRRAPRTIRLAAIRGFLTTRSVSNVRFAR